jgi:hypothetical protein
MVSHSFSFKLPLVGFSNTRVAPGLFLKPDKGFKFSQGAYFAMCLRENNLERVTVFERTVSLMLAYFEPKILNNREGNR